MFRILEARVESLSLLARDAGEIVGDFSGVGDGGGACNSSGGSTGGAGSVGGAGVGAEITDGGL